MQKHPTNIPESTTEQMINELQPRLHVSGEFTVPHMGGLITAYFVRDFELSITTGDDVTEPVEIAQAEVHLLLTEHAENLVSEADKHSAPMHTAVTDIFSGDKFNRLTRKLYPKLRNKNILLVDSLWVTPEHRSKGLGRTIMETIFELTRGLAGLVVVVPYTPEIPAPTLSDPTDIAELKMQALLTGEERLERFFVRCGFRKITDETLIFCTEYSDQPNEEVVDYLRLMYPISPEQS